jgi:hypothetical protein
MWDAGLEMAPDWYAPQSKAKADKSTGLIWTAMNENVRNDAVPSIEKMVERGE